MQRGMRREGRGPSRRPARVRVGFSYLFWNHAWKLIRLNLLFLACCIPVVTMPAALCAMDRALIVLVREGNVLLWEEFRDEFKKDFWRSLPLGLLFGGLLFLGYFLLSLGMGNFGTFLGPMFFAFGLFTIGFALGRGSYAFLMRAMVRSAQRPDPEERQRHVRHARRPRAGCRSWCMASDSCSASAFSRTR